MGGDLKFGTVNNKWQNDQIDTDSPEVMDLKYATVR